MDISAPESLCRLVLVMEPRRLYRQAVDVSAGMMLHTGQATLDLHLSSVPMYFSPAQPPSVGLPIVHLTPGPEPRTEHLARIAALPSPLLGGAEWTAPCLPGIGSPLS
jgi:hypothetical protein